MSPGQQEVALFPVAQSCSVPPLQNKDTIFFMHGSVLNYKMRGKKSYFTATWLAQLVERQSAVREVEGSSPGPEQHSGECAVFLIISANV